MTLIDSVYKKDKNYYPNMALAECKYIIKEKKMRKCIRDGM